MGTMFSSTRVDNQTTRKTVQFICDYEEKNQPKEEMLLIYDGNVGERFFRKTMISL